MIACAIGGVQIGFFLSGGTGNIITPHKILLPAIHLVEKVRHH